MNREKKERGGLDPWENTVWIDDMPVPIGRKLGRWWGLTGNGKMIKFMSERGNKAPHKPDMIQATE